jgi:hypothetical protein
MAWDEMTVTLGGGDALFTALWSTTVGTLGGHWARAWEGEIQKYVGGHEVDNARQRRVPTIPLYPFSHDETADHSYHDVYESMMCTLAQKKKWIIAISSSDPVGYPLLNSLLPVQIGVRGVSESIHPEPANTKVTLNLAFANPL